MESFNFCPKCGGKFVDNNEKSKRCLECGFIYYFNPSAAVAAIIRNDEGDILISVRDREPAKGCYDLPGGFVDSYESGEQSVRREVKEECHIELSEVKYLFSRPNIYNYSNFEVHTLDLFYECKASSLSSLEADDDVAALQFIPIKDIDLSKFGFSSIREGLGRYIEEIARP